MLSLLLANLADGRADLLTAEQIFDECLRRADMPARAELDWDVETFNSYASRFGDPIRGIVERACRFATLLAEDRCLAELRDARRLLA